ncbi:RidA family protein [Aquimarina megaterium]|uniref:RidA family protein n=1 Tax=Aquimarina megaterium TaxID=1443666 RepID=UPI0009449351|nr:RidA family protein [Aquimarina megaterium]
MKTNTTENKSKNGPHLSPWMEHNGVLYLSGQIGMNKVTKEIPEGIEAQTKLVLQNIENTLKEAGSTKNHILRNDIFLSDIAHWEMVNEIYSNFFGEFKSARMVVGNTEMYGGCLIEITTTATTVE